MPTGPLSIRAAEEADGELLLSWVNDPAVRRMAFSPDSIGPGEHGLWFQDKLRDDDCLLYIVTAPDGEPVGQVRFDVDELHDAVISISIAPAWRGHGLASEAIRLATAEARRCTNLAAIHAYIKAENEASIRAFARAGFGPPEPITYRGSAAVRMSVGL